MLGVKQEWVNVLAVEGFVTDGGKYKAIDIVLGDRGSVGAWQGSTLPNREKFAEIVEGKYQMTKHLHKGKDAISLNNDGIIKTTRVNENLGNLGGNCLLIVYDLNYEV